MPDDAPVTSATGLLMLVMTHSCAWKPIGFRNRRPIGFQSASRDVAWAYGEPDTGPAGSSGFDAHPAVGRGGGALLPGGRGRGGGGVVPRGRGVQALDVPAVRQQGRAGGRQPRTYCARVRGRPVTGRRRR